MGTSLEVTAGRAAVWTRWSWAWVAFLALAAHLPALACGFVWDDVAIVGHPVFADGRGLLRIWTEPGAIRGEVHYWPLTYTTLWIEEQLFGGGPFGHHLGNLVLHALNAVLLGLVLERLAIRGAWLAAALFAVHPVHVEAVTWVVVRKDLLATAFCGLACLAWLRSERESSRRSALAASVALFACAMLSKSMALGLPLILAAIQWWRHGRLTRLDVLALAPFALVGGALALHDVALTQRLDPFELDLNWVERLQVASRSVWFYLGKLLWPVDLVPIHPRWSVDARAVLDYLPVAALAAMLAGGWLGRRRFGRGLLAALVVFLVALGPTLGWIDFYFLRYSFVADRFQYLASAAPLTLAGSALARWPASRRRRMWLVTALLLPLAATSLWRTFDFASDERLFARNVEVNPQTWMAWCNLGTAKLNRGDTNAALQCLERAAALAPREVLVLNNLGATLHALGRYEEALGRFEEALRIDPDHPRAHSRLGLTLGRLGRSAEGIEHYRRALELDPELSTTRFNLGMALAQTGELEAAERELRELVRREPERAEAQHALASVLVARGNWEGARACLVEALRLDPRLEGTRELLTTVEARLQSQAPPDSEP